MTEYTELVKELRFGAEYGCDYDLIERATAAIEELSAQLPDKDYQIREQWDEIKRLRADVKRQQEKMIELAKKLPKRGRWIDDEFGAKCSYCGKYAYWSKFELPWKSPYCPLCGAKMEVQDA